MQELGSVANASAKKTLQNMDRVKKDLLPLS